jgi:predicted phage tail protein
MAPAKNNSGTNTTYVDTAVTAGNTYQYQVYAVNANGPSLAPTNIASAAVAAVPAAPTNFTVAVTSVRRPNGRFDYTANLAWSYGANPSSFTIQRANNLDFTTGLTTFTPAAAARTLSQAVNPNTVYYYRIRANNSVGGSSAWTNALPFPIRTGPVR